MVAVLAVCNTLTAAAAVFMLAGADHVVGLDVDKDAFDKHHMRHAIDNLLLELIKDSRCAASLTALAAAPPPAAAAAASGFGGAGVLADDWLQAGEGLFVDFASACLNDLIYLLKDALSRLADVRRIEVAQADEVAWKALPATERNKKLDFVTYQQGMIRSYLRMATTTLQLLTALSAMPGTAASFLRPPLSNRAAYAVLHFIDLLAGPNSEQVRRHHMHHHHTRHCHALTYMP